MAEVKGGVSKALKEMQPNPVGTEPRSKREVGILLKEIANSPNQETKQAKMQELANLAGHKGDKLDNCSLCNVIRSRLKG